MKRITALVLLLSILTGCTRLSAGEYLSIRPHEETAPQTAETDAVVVEDYLGLRTAVKNFVRTGQTEGVIRVNSYEGDVEADLTEVVYEVSKTDPFGAYAVEYMTHECVRIVSYYEIRIHTTFRRSLQELEAVEITVSQKQLEERLERAMEQGEELLLLQMNDYQNQDLADMIQTFCVEHPDVVMETPAMEVQMYPQNGRQRILEVRLTYTLPWETLQQRRTAVQETVDGAAEYIRYREKPMDKAQLLYTYLITRFSYTQQETVTPVYSALCEGAADPLGLAQGWKLICDKAGVECYVVQGLRNGQPYTWNIFSLDGEYRHVDLAQCVLERGGLILRTDKNMGEYHWDTSLYPACEIQAAGE